MAQAFDDEHQAELITRGWTDILDFDNSETCWLKLAKPGSQRATSLLDQMKTSTSNEFNKIQVIFSQLVEFVYFYFFQTGP